MTVRLVTLIVAISAALATALPALAHPPGPALGVAIEGLRTVSVSYNTDSGFTELEADAIARRVGDSSTVAVALVAPSAILLSGAEATAKDVAAHLEDGRTYVVASRGRVGVWHDEGDADELRALVGEVRRAHRGQPTALVVADLASRLEERSRADAADDAPAWLWPAVAVGSLAALLAAAIALRRRGRPQPADAAGQS